MPTVCADCSCFCAVTTTVSIWFDGWAVAVVWSAALAGVSANAPQPQVNANIDVAVVNFISISPFVFPAAIGRFEH